VITVNSYRDIYKRTRYPAHARAVLQLGRSVGLPGPLVMGANFVHHHPPAPQAGELQAHLSPLLVSASVARPLSAFPGQG